MNAQIPPNDNDESKELEAFDDIMNEAQRIKKKEEWKKKLKEIDANQKSKTNKKNKIWIAIGSIFGILVLAFLIYGNRVVKIEDEAIQYAMNTDVYFNTLSTTRGDAEAVQPQDATRKSLSESLRSKAFEDAIKSFALLDEKGMLTISEKFDYAVTLLKAKDDNVKKAIDLLDEVLEQNTRFHAEALWFSALANIIAENKGNAIEQLEKLKTHKYKTSETIGLLDQLKSN